MALLLDLAGNGVIQQRRILSLLKSSEVLPLADVLRAKVVQSRSSITKTQHVASWSSIMSVYLLDRAHELLLHSGCLCASEFVAAVLAEPQWSKVVENALEPDVIATEVTAKLVDADTELHPKFKALASLVKEQVLCWQDLNLKRVRSDVS